VTFTIKAQPLQSFAREIFAAAATPDDIAACVAESLVTTNLMGHDSHGVLRVKQYVSMIRRGMIKPSERPRVRKRVGAVAMVTLAYGFGQIGARFAAEMAIEMAREHGIAAVSLGQTTHVGRLGEWTGMIAAGGMIGIGFAGGGFSHGFVAPYGGRERLFSTNPMSFAVPCGDEETLLLDFATSGVAHGKVMLAQSKGEPLPQGMMLDKAGRPTTEAADLGEMRARVEALLPGEPEARSYAERLKYGIPLPDQAWADLCGLADELGVKLPAPPPAPPQSIAEG